MKRFCCINSVIIILIFISVLFLSGKDLAKSALTNQDNQQTVSLSWLFLLLGKKTVSVAVPVNQFNVGDSIGEGEAADGTIGESHHETVWSTGYDAGDSVNSLNERFENSNATDYYENNSDRDGTFNQAISGADMADFQAQAQKIVTATAGTQTENAGMITILLGNNDVCASNLDAMTDPILFEQQYRAGLDIFAASAETRSAYIHVSSIPAIYWLWNAKRNVDWCRIIA